MYNLFNCSKNFRKKTGSFWNYYPDIPKSGHNDDDNLREGIIYPIKNSESFDYKTKLVGILGANLPPVNNLVKAEKDVKIIMPLKNLSSFIFNLNFLMTNTEIELILKWSQNYVLTEKATREEKAREVGPPVLDPVNAINRPEDLKFNITDSKLYVPAVTLQEKYENKLFEGLKTGINIDFQWPRFRTQIINQPATNNLHFLIDPTFNNVNRLFVLAFPNKEDRSSFSKYYTPTIEIKEYNVLIDLQPFYDTPIKK